MRVDPAAFEEWTTTRVTARGEELEVATKPGVLGHGALDPAVGLLLDHLEIEPGESLIDVHCGAGAVSALAGHLVPGAAVAAYDRNLLAVEAARRTLALNGIDGEVTFAVGPPPAVEGVHDVASVRLPQGRIPTLQLLWHAFRALRPGGVCYLAGANDEGIRSAIRAMEEIFGEATVLGYRGGHRVASALRPDEPAAAAARHAIPWTDPEAFHRFTAETPVGPLEIFSRPGVFSWDHLDVGSEALLRAMRVEPGASVLELGCGYGVVGVAAAVASRDGPAVLVDVDVEAVRCARLSAAAAGVADRVEVIASDAAAAVLDRRFDLVLSNPPFHLEKGTNLAIPARFIHDAARVLRPGGRLLLVANRTLPYERWIEERFGGFEIVHDGREFKVLAAVRSG